MKKEIFINATSQEMRVAITEDKRLAELFLELPDHERHVGSIHIGRVERVVQGMNAAFVDIGLEQHAFLHFSDAENAGEDYSDLLTEDDDEEASSRSSKKSSRSKSGGRSSKKSSKKSTKSTKKSSRKKSGAKSDEEDEEKKSSKSSSKKSSKKSSSKKTSSKKSSSKKSTKKSSKKSSRKSDETEESKSGGEEKKETSGQSSSKRSRSRRGRGSSKKSSSGTEKEQTETSEKNGDKQKKEEGSEEGPKKSSRGRSRGRGSRSKKGGDERPTDNKQEGASQKKEVESGTSDKTKSDGKPDSSEGNEEKKGSSSRRRSSRRRGGSKKSQEGSEKQASGESSKKDRKDGGSSSEKESRSDRDGNKKNDGSSKKESGGEGDSKKSGSSSRSRSRSRGGSRSRGSSSSDDGQSTKEAGAKGSDRKDSEAKGSGKKSSDNSKGSDRSKGSNDSRSSTSSKSSSKRSSRSRGSSKKSAGSGDSSNKSESSSSKKSQKSSDSSDKGEGSKKSASRSRSRSRSRSSSKKSDDGGPKRMDAKLPTFQTRRHGEIQIDLKRGQEILVQVIRESYASKGVKVSTKVSLPGRFLVLMPVDPTIGISRKVVDVKERRRLRSIAKKILPDGFGCIIRTVAEKKETKMLEEELKMLLERWREIEAKLKKAKGPMKLYSDVSVASGVMRDMFTRDVNRVVIDSKPLHQEIKDYVSWAAPALQNKIEHYDGKEPIFAKFGLERDLDRMMATKVYLNNGGYIILEQTEAMMVIDVNSGRYAKSKEQELNALEINLESAREIARQIRLRDIGGLIVIDFIDLYEEKNRRKVHEEMKRAMSRDRAKSVVLPMTQFGIVQMTRQRIRQQLVETMSEECPTCRGTGTVQSKGTTLRAIENWLVNFRAESREFRLTLTANPQIVEFLSDGDGMSRLTKMMLKHFVRIKLVPDESLDMETFRFHSTRRQEDITEKYLGASTEQK